MAEVKTLQFPNTEEGQRQKVQALQRHIDGGWTIVSETVTPGHFKGGKACCLTTSGLVCCGPVGASAGLAAGSTEGIITVTLSRKHRPAVSAGEAYYVGRWGQPDTRVETIVKGERCVECTWQESKVKVTFDSDGNVISRTDW